jgi:hypothetical protein
LTLTSSPFQGAVLFCDALALVNASVEGEGWSARHGSNLYVLLRDGASESETMTLMAINADPTQVDDMINTLCNLRGMSTAASDGTAVN